MTVDTPPRWNVMRDGQKFNNTLQDNGRLTSWTECHARWSKIQQHLVTQQSTHSLNGMSCEMVRNSITPCKMTVDSPTGRNVMRDGQKFNNTLRDDGRLTNWTECHARWSEIQQHLARRWSTHSLDGVSCEMVRNSATPCETTVNSLPGWNVMRDGQNFNNTLQDDDRLTSWTECHARWSEIQQHLGRWRSTHFLDRMSCKMVRNSTTPCKTTIDSWTGQNVMWDGQKFNNTLGDDSQLTSWTECHARWSEIQQHLARRQSTHQLDRMSCEMVRNSTTPCETTVDLPTGWNVMRDGQKFNNTLQDDSRLMNWTECHARWSEI